MTQLEAAREGIVTQAMKTVAANENVDVETVRAAVASGEAVIPLNPAHRNCLPENPEKSNMLDLSKL